MTHSPWLLALPLTHLQKSLYKLTMHFWMREHSASSCSYVELASTVRTFTPQIFHHLWSPGKCLFGNHMVAPCRSYHRIGTEGGDNGFGMICALHRYYVFNYFNIAVFYMAWIFVKWPSTHKHTHFFFRNWRKSIVNLSLLYIFHNRMYDYYKLLMFIYWLL